jgi:hypothetical protein
MRDKVNKEKKKIALSMYPSSSLSLPAFLTFLRVTLCNFVAKKNEQKGWLMRILRRQPNGQWKAARAIWTE